MQQVLSAWCFNVLNRSESSIGWCPTRRNSIFQIKSFKNLSNVQNFSEIEIVLFRLVRHQPIGQCSIFPSAGVPPDETISSKQYL